MIPTNTNPVSLRRTQVGGHESSHQPPPYQFSKGRTRPAPKARRKFFYLTKLVLLFLLGIYFAILSNSLVSLEGEIGNLIPTRRHFAQDAKLVIPSESVQVNDEKDIDYQWIRNIQVGNEILNQMGPGRIRKILTAYLESPLNDTIPGTGSQGDIDNPKDQGLPPKFYIPMPLRTTSPEDLIKIEYPKLQTCHDIPAKIPVDRGLELDNHGIPIIRNIGGEPTPDNYPMLEAPFCPVDADPFLPWIHDVFPSVDGSRIEFIAQNKRRCKTGKNHRKDVKRMEPQVALLQPISVKRIDEEEARRLAPELWTLEGNSAMASPARYRLASYEEASQDGMYTRFICRFHTSDFTQDPPQSVLVGETLSTFPFNYDFVAYRKSKGNLFTPKGKDTNMFWTSNLRFSCPVPDEWKNRVASGSTVLSDGTPTVFVDVVPIRTSPRHGSEEAYFTEDLTGPIVSREDASRSASHHKISSPIGFDATKRWGDRQVLPRVEASGRWENIPICYAPKPVDDNQSYLKLKEISKANAPSKEHKDTTSQKPHLLSACLWAADSFKTRGVDKESRAIKDTKHRLAEWIEFHLMVGFDHIYVYDNSGAHSNETSFADILSNYPSSKVTRIDWPSLVCNNNIPAHDNTGERSSQYAAENSCRTRYAPFTEWIASIDTDEYLVPMGNYTNLRDVVRDAAKQGTNILTFRSTRGRLRIDSSKAVGKGRMKMNNVSFLQAYNCDSSALPKPSWADRAQKQIYRSDYVLYHHVHYSTVTKGYLESYNDTVTAGRKWHSRYSETEPSERVTDEEFEAVMIHTKDSDEKLTANYLSRCHYQFEKKYRGCYVGYPWPNGTEVPRGHDENGMSYNCFINKKVEDFWLPRLRQALAQKKYVL